MPESGPTGQASGEVIKPGEPIPGADSVEMPLVPHTETTESHAGLAIDPMPAEAEGDATEVAPPVVPNTMPGAPAQPDSTTPEVSANPAALSREAALQEHAAAHKEADTSIDTNVQLQPEATEQPEKVGWFKRLFGGKKHDEVTSPTANAPSEIVIKGPLPEGLKQVPAPGNGYERFERLKAVEAVSPTATGERAAFIDQGGAPPPGVEQPNPSDQQDPQDKIAA